MDTPQPQPGLDQVELADGLTLDEARALEASAMAAYAEGRVIPHERMIPYIDALFRGENPSRPKTDAELEAEKAQHR